MQALYATLFFRTQRFNSSGTKRKFKIICYQLQLDKVGKLLFFIQNSFAGQYALIRKFLKNIESNFGKCGLVRLIKPLLFQTTGCCSLEFFHNKKAVLNAEVVYILQTGLNGVSLFVFALSFNLLSRCRLAYWF
jgi:hypothetical protein